MYLLYVYMLRNHRSIMKVYQGKKGTSNMPAPTHWFKPLARQTSVTLQCRVPGLATCNIPLPIADVLAASLGIVAHSVRQGCTRYRSPKYASCYESGDTL